MGRLWTTIRPIRARLFLGLLSALTASIVALLIPQVLQRLVDRLEADPTRTAVLTAGAAVLALGLVEASLIWLRRTFAVAPATTAEKQMRVRFYDKVQRMPVAFHDAWGSGQLLSRSMSDINQIRRWVAFGMIMVVTSSVTILVGVALLVRASPLLAGVFLLGAAPVTAISYRFSRRYHALSRLSQDQSGDLATTIEQSVQGIRVLKAFGRGPTALDVFTGQADELRRTEVRKATAMASFTAAIFALPELALGVALYLGLHGVAAGTMDVGRLAAYFATATLVIGPTRMLGQLLGQAVNTTTALERHYEVMDEPDTITSPDHPVPVDGESACGDVRFENVRFRYPDAPTRGGDLLDGVDLHVRPGETMALVGLTGSGKSTLLQLVPRLYDVTGGRITVDGVDVREMGLTDLRRLTAVAFEDATLFSDSVRANVLLGADPGLDPEESDDLLHLALRTADAGFTLDLPDGVETRIGEQGLSLSGGQRQRLAQARSPPAPGCCSSTTRSPRSTPAPRRPSPPACVRSSPARRPSSSPTAPRPSRSPTAWPFSTVAGSSPSAPTPTSWRPPRATDTSSPTSSARPPTTATSPSSPTRRRPRRPRRPREDACRSSSSLEGRRHRRPRRRRAP